MTLWCWSTSISAAGRKRLNKPIKKASSILGCPLETVQVVGESRMMDKLSSLLEKESHTLQVTFTALCSSISHRLKHPRCVKRGVAGPTVRERYRRSKCVKERCDRSFLLPAVRLYSPHFAIKTLHMTHFSFWTTGQLSFPYLLFINNNTLPHYI